MTEVALDRALLLQAVNEVARLAGDVALQHFQTSLSVELKGDGSPVTVADREAEHAARAWIARRFPNDGVLGEEFGAEKPEAERQWLVDPVDGTKSFIHGVPLWGTLVAVCERGEVIAGAAYFPALAETLAAAIGAGCWWNGARCHVSAIARDWGDCYGYLLVATGRAEVMVDPMLADWDAAPLYPAILEAGGVFTSYEGVATPFGKSAVATNDA